MKNGWKSILAVGSLLFLTYWFTLAHLGSQSTRAELAIKQGDREVRIATDALKTSPQHVPTADSKDFREYYVDTMRGLYFKLPNSKNWSKPELVKGLEAYIEKGGMPLTPEIRKRARAFESSPMLGPLAREVETLILTSGEPIELEITNETSSQAVNLMIELVKLGWESKGVKLSEKPQSTTSFSQERFLPSGGSEDGALDTGGWAAWP